MDEGLAGPVIGLHLFFSHPRHCAPGIVVGIIVAISVVAALGLLWRHQVKEVGPIIAVTALHSLAQFHAKQVGMCLCIAVADSFCILLTTVCPIPCA